MIVRWYSIGRDKREVMLSEFYFEGKLWHIANNESYEVASGVYCDNYEIIGDLEHDLAMIHVSPNAKTPCQLIKNGDRTIEVFISGSGRLIIEDSRGMIFEHYFQEKEKNDYVEVAVGEKMQWVAGDKGLCFVEICKPPYKEGRFESIE